MTSCWHHKNNSTCSFDGRHYVGFSILYEHLPQLRLSFNICQVFM